MPEFFAYAARVVIIFLFTYFGARILTKKAIAEMTAYEMAGIILLTNVAAEPLVTKITTKAVFGTGFIALLMILTSRLALINKLTPVMEHTPTVVVKNGSVDMNAIKRMELSLNQLYGLLRQKGYSKVADVEYALIEPQGNISVLPKSQKRPVQPSDINVTTQYEGLTVPLIMDGSIIEKNLEHVMLTKDWLLNALKVQGVNDYKSQVIIAELDTSGNLNVTKKH
ncbi:MAG: DUF421 domain-containing protein [Firmicutes bacterium]|nr:DUF421 domain-containing protein [Bacillota bacterium]